MEGNGKNGHEKLLRFCDVLAQLGGDRNYARKLRAAGVFRIYKPAADCRPRYYQSDVDAVLTGNGKADKKGKQ